MACLCRVAALGEVQTASPEAGEATERVPGGSSGRMERRRARVDGDGRRWKRRGRGVEPRGSLRWKRVEAQSKRKKAKQEKARNRRRMESARSRGRKGPATPRLTGGARFWYSDRVCRFWPFMKSSDLMMRLFFLWMFDFHTL